MGTMTTKTIHYNTRGLMQAGKVTEATNGFRALHTDFTNNNQADGFEVFYDDQASNVIPPTLRSLTQRQLLEEIALERNVNLT